MAWGRPFQKGQSGNPRGRPKQGQTLTEILRRVLAEADTEGKNRGEALADRLLALTRSPDGEIALAAMKYIYDRLDGKPAETQQITGANGGPLALMVVEKIVTDRKPDA